MKRFLLAGLALLLVGALTTVLPPQPSQAQGRSGDQQMARLRFAKDGVQSQGSGVLQTAQVGTLSAAVATATRTEVVAAPASGSTVVLGIFVEKATATTGSVTLTQGTGTNCATSPTVILTIGAGSPAIGYYAVNAILPAAKAFCLTTDAATTSARALTQ